MNRLDCCDDDDEYYNKCLCMQAALPNSIRIFKTQLHPLPADCESGVAFDPRLGKKSHIVQLDAAGRYVASEHHW